MPTISPQFEQRAGEAVGDWMPSRYTPALTGDELFVTKGDRLIALTLRVWSTPAADRFELDEWQRWLIRHVLEVYPDDWPVEHLRGHLRFRQVVISMGRQNGKSLIAAVFVLFFLVMHVRGPRIIGLASIDRQAKIVYDRVRYGIDNSPDLARELRTTRTRGIERRDGSGLYQTLPAKEDSAQGEPASGFIYDELHLGLAALWDALVLAQRGQPFALGIGITTAGDADSQLLVRLYKDGEVAIEGGDERFGFYCWEGEDDELTEANVIRANPSIACGRNSLDVAMAESAKMWRDTEIGPDGLTGRQRVVRYTLNRFIAGAADSWASITAWQGQGNPENTVTGGEVVYTVERTASWEAASITATTYRDGLYTTELVASILEPDMGLLFEACQLLAKRGRAVFAMDGFTLRKLGEKLREDGREVTILGEAEMQSAAQHTHAQIGRRVVNHPGDALLAAQMGRAKKRDTGDGWRISRSLSPGDIDAVIGLAIGVYIAHTRGERTRQLF